MLWQTMCPIRCSPATNGWRMSGGTRSLAMWWVCQIQFCILYRIHNHCFRSVWRAWIIWITTSTLTASPRCRWGYLMITQIDSRGSWPPTTWWSGAPGISSTLRYTSQKLWAYFKTFSPDKELSKHCSLQLLLRAPDDVTVGEIKQQNLISRANDVRSNYFFGNTQVFEWHPSDPAVLVAGLANGQLVGSSSPQLPQLSGALGPEPAPGGSREGSMYLGSQVNKTLMDRVVIWLNTGSSTPIKRVRSGMRRMGEQRTSF